jgi:hypothetical protein
VLDCLCCGNERRVEHLLVGDLSGNIVSFLENAIDRRTIDAAGVQSAHLEGPLESVDVSLRLPQMRLEAHL